MFTHKPILIFLSLVGTLMQPVSAQIAESRAPDVSLEATLLDWQNIVLSWPVPESGRRYELETSVTLDEDRWGVVDNPVSIFNGRHELSFSPENDTQRYFRLRELAPVWVAETSPRSSESHVSPTRRFSVYFSDPVDISSITEGALLLEGNGGRVGGRLIVSSSGRFVDFLPDQPLMPSTEYRFTLDGGGIVANEGREIDADGDGIPGGVLEGSFRTLSLSRIPGTVVWGIVRDSYSQQPIAGATIRVDAFPEANAVTDATGRFELRDMPAPEFFVHIDGSTATNAPAGFVYPNVGKPFHSVPGQVRQIEMDGSPFDIFLPPMALDDIQALDPDDATQVGFGEAGKAALAEMFPEMDATTWDRMVVNFEPGSAIDNSGNASTQAAIVPVPPDRIPAPLPGIFDPTLVVSVQAVGATRFDTPAPVSFPNMEGLAAGEKSMLFSFNHSAGKWESIGTGTVTADGLSVVSDPGVGIRAPGWHFAYPLNRGGPPDPCRGDVRVIRFELPPGHYGDIIEVFHLPFDFVPYSQALSPEAQQCRSAAGQDFLSGGWRLADVDDWQGLFKEGVMYLVPPFPTGDERFDLPQKIVQMVIEGEVDGSRLPVIVQFHTVSAGYSKSGDRDAVTFGNRKLDYYRQRQRLRWLGFEGQGSPLRVSGRNGTDLQKARALFNLVVEDRSAPEFADRFSPASQIMLNARNAPTWQELAMEGPGWRRSPAASPTGFWGPNWTHEVIEDAGLKNSEERFDVSLITTRFGELSAAGIHKQWGLHVDVETRSTDSGSVPFYRTYRSGGRTYIATASSTGAGGAPIRNVIVRDLVADRFVAWPLDWVLNPPVNQPIVDPLEHHEAWENPGVLGEIRNLILDNIDAGYDINVVRAHIAAFDGASGASGASVDRIYYNDPRTWPLATFSPGLGGHFIVDLLPAAAVLAAEGEDENEVPESTSHGFGSDLRLHFRFQFEDGTEFRGASELDGQFEVFLPPNAPYTATYYQPSTNRSVVHRGSSNGTGIETVLPYIELFDFGGPDTDGDGLPDVGEGVLGTDADNVDTDGDGISDAAELAQNTNPADGRITSTGILARLSLVGAGNGTATRLEIVGDTAYVMTSRHLIVVDVTDSSSPVIVSSTPLPNVRDAEARASLAVNERLGLVVASMGFPFFFDISNGSSPVLLEVMSEGATEPIFVENWLYALSGGDLLLIDPVTRTIVDREIYAEGRPGESFLRDVTTSLGHLYVVSTENSTDWVTKIPLGSHGFLDEPVDRFEVGPGSKIWAPRIEVGSGRVYLSGLGVLPPEMVILEESAGAMSKLGESSNLGVSRAAFTGSGNGIYAGSAQTDDTAFFLVNVRNPENGIRSLSQFPTAGLVADPVISRGLVFGLGHGEISVISFLPFDAARVAPTVGVDLSGLDSDPSLPGLQLIEGNWLHVDGNATDDVQVREVELFVNGSLIARDNSFPWHFELAPSIADFGNEVAIAIRAVDTGGNVSDSDATTVLLVPQAEPPAVVATSPGLGEQFFESEDRSTISLTFSEPVDQSIRDLVGLTVARDGREMTLTSAELSRVGDRLTILLSEPMRRGDYKFTIRAGGVLDRFGNATSSTFTSSWVVDPDNIAPEIAGHTFPMPDEMILDGTLVGASITFSEPMDTTDIAQGISLKNTATGTTVPWTSNVVEEGRTVTFQFTALGAGSYEVELNAPSLRDRFGNALGTEIERWPFSIIEAARDTDLFNGRLYPIDYGGGEVACGDLNGDGLADAVATDLTFGKMAVFLATGSGRFTEQPHATYPAAQHPRWVVLADVNGDSLLDSLGLDTNGEIAVRLGNGDGTFGDAIALGFPSTAKGKPTVADFNGDGAVDIAVAAATGAVVRLGTGDASLFGTPMTHDAALAPRVTPLDISSGDLNNDDFSDLLVLGNDNRATVLLGKADGGFDLVLEQKATGFYVGSVELADLDGDGNLDLIAGNIYRGEGDGTFERIFVQAAPTPIAGRRLADMNGDGLQDLVGYAATREGEDVAISLGDAGARFLAPRRFYRMRGFTSGIDTGDVDGDGNLDVVTSGRGGVLVDLGDGEGGIRNQQDRVYPLADEALPGVEETVAADLNGDGHLDLVVGASNRAIITVFQGNGDGTLQAGIEYSTLEDVVPLKVLAAHADGDNHLDLVVSGGRGAENRQGIYLVSIHRGRGDGSFEPPVLAHEDLRAQRNGGLGLTAKLDSSQRIEVLAVGNSGQIELYGLTGGTLQKDATIDAPGFNAPLIADFNGDGTLDIAAGSLSPQLLGARLNVWLGDITGGFAEPTTYEVDSRYDRFVAGDFDGDGDTDVVHAGESSLSLLQNDGSGTFVMTTDPFPEVPGDPTALDINLDGIDDVILRRANTTVLLGQLSSVFERKDYACPGFIGAGDFDQDGDFDGVGLIRTSYVVDRREIPKELLIICPGQLVVESP